MRFLLISDTHGHLDIINDLARKTKCDAVVHAGDFGFYDADSHKKLSPRELKLHIVHSELSKDQKQELLHVPVEQQRVFVQKHLPLSDLPAYLTGEKVFSVPVFTVWGNHEDVDVVKKFYTGEYSVRNLTVLHENVSHHVKGVHLFGLGGNYLFGEKLLQKPIAGGGGKIWTTLSQYAQLLDTIKKDTKEDEYRILVSHVSSGKEPFIKLLGIHTNADLIVSGHMGSPFTMVWNDFAICSLDASKQGISGCVEELRSLFGEIDQKKNPELWDALERLIDYPEEEVSIGREKKAPWWYRDMCNVNLPDAEIGYAVLEIEVGKVGLETCSPCPKNGILP